MSFTDYYNDLKDNPNNISYWYPKIKDCGINVPKTLIFDVPENIVECFFMEGNQQKNMDDVYEWVKTTIMPTLNSSEIGGLIFMKNGAFSNKFDFDSCSIRANALEITRNLIEINYTSLMFETGGNTEVAIRERIPFREDETPCIYHGMPLRNEYRVFYDFDNHKALYVVNYWDWDYCHEAISRNATDKFIYEAVYPQLNQHYVDNCECVMNGVAEHMKDITGLSGIWSIDILEDEHQCFWLIDMALGHRSAYWDPVKAGVSNG